MGIERIVKNNLSQGACSHLQIIFYRCDRNQKPWVFPNRSGRGCRERPATAFAGQVTIAFLSRRNFMMRTGKQRIVPQQFTVKTLISRFNFKGRNGLGYMHMSGCSVYNPRMMCVRVPRPRQGGRCHQENPGTGQQKYNSSGRHARILSILLTFARLL